MNNLVDYNGIWYTLKNQDIFLTKKIMIIVIKERGE